MMRLVAPYLLAALVPTVAAVGVWVWLQSAWLEDAEYALRNARAELATCANRVTNLKEDMQSDATVDNPADFNVPDYWMFTPPGPRTGK